MYTSTIPATMPAMRPGTGFLAALAMTVVATLTNLPAQASESSSKRSSKTEKRQSSRITIQQTRSSSEETPAQRDKRLYRECQGLPNSGACAGYTRRR